jgi:O-antigen ligase
MKRGKRKAAPAVETASAIGPRIDGVVRGLMLVFAATLPLYFDPGVIESTSDIRWAAALFFAGLCAALLVFKALAAGSAQGSLRWPLIFWLALGLAVWAALSLIDAVNWMRGLIPMKALVAQLTLIAVVYRVATPVFLRRLMWALTLPLAFTSALGIVQFKGWNLPGFAGDVAAFYPQAAVPASTFANKNLAASWTAMMLPLALYLLVTARHWYAQAAASTLLALGSLFLIYSRSRASWVALLGAMMTLAALVLLLPPWRKAVLPHLDWKRAVWLLPPAVALLGYGGDVSPVPDSDALRRTPAQQVGALLRTESSGSDIGARLAYNLNSLAITRDHWFNGVGLGNFVIVYPAYHDAVAATPASGYSVEARPQHAHNDLMQAFDETGVPGGLLYAGVFVCAIAMAFRLAGRSGARAPQGETDLADETRLLGMMAGIGVLTIGINALMDFPMQLPAAPAAAALLMGAITSLHLRDRPATLVGPEWTQRLAQPALAGCFATVIALWGAVCYDAWMSRQANAVLKAAVWRGLAGNSDALTLELANLAVKLYPYDPRVHQELGIAYAAYSGSPPLPDEIRIEKLESALKGDPWGTNYLIHLAYVSLRHADRLLKKGDAQQAALILGRVEELYARMQRAAGFSPYTWSLGGSLRLLQGKHEDAVVLLRKALAIEPTYAPAQRLLAIASESARPKP